MTDIDLPDLGAHSQLGKSAFFLEAFDSFFVLNLTQPQLFFSSTLYLVTRYRYPSRRFAYFFTLVKWEQYIG